MTTSSNSFLLVGFRSDFRLRDREIPSNLLKDSESNDSHRCGEIEFMPSFCALDSGKEVELSRTLFQSFFKVGNVNKQQSSGLVRVYSKNWDFWRLDDSERVCLFRKDGRRYFGLKTDLLDPAKYGDLASQAASSLECVTRSRLADSTWYRDKLIPAWFEMISDHLRLRFEPSFTKDSFSICYDDESLLSGIRHPDLDGWTALARGHLCFIRNEFDGKWLILKDDRILAEKVDLRQILVDQEKAGFESLLKSIREDEGKKLLGRGGV